MGACRRSIPATATTFQPMKHFQVLVSGRPIFFFEVGEEFADDDASPRNLELANNLAQVLQVTRFGPSFVPQLISKIPLVLADRKPDFCQEGLNAWVAPKLGR